MLEYDRICDWYAKARSPHIGVPDVTALTQRLAPGSKILDLGCGNGVPISRALIQSGFAVFGVDSSKEMITRFTEHCPNAPAECATIQGSEFFHTVFDAAVAWGVLFHLAPADQELAISRVARVLKQDGMFLFTAGAEEGTAEGQMNDIPFHYASLGTAKYRAALREHRFDVTDEYSDEWDNHVFIARKHPRKPAPAVR